MSNNNGGPAFPVEKKFQKMSDGSHVMRNVGHAGMSLRDWFAGQALIGFCSRNNIGEPAAVSVAWMCYSMADAMVNQKEVSDKQ